MKIVAALVIVMAMCFFVSVAILSPALASRRMDIVSGATPSAEGAAVSDIQEAAIIARNFEYLPGTITIEKGLPARLYLTSIDRTHDIKIEKMDLRAKVVKGEITVLDFTPAEAGVFEYVCNTYCGSGHRGMKAKIMVIDANKSEGAKND